MTHYDSYYDTLWLILWPIWLIMTHTEYNLGWKVKDENVKQTVETNIAESNSKIEWNKLRLPWLKINKKSIFEVILQGKGLIYTQ